MNTFRRDGKRQAGFVSALLISKSLRWEHIASEGPTGLMCDDCSPLPYSDLLRLNLFWMLPLTELRRFLYIPEICAPA